MVDSWHGINNRRKFFEEYAAANLFDPLEPEKWYSQSNTKIMSFEVLDHYTIKVYTNYSNYEGC